MFCNSERDERTFVGLKSNCHTIVLRTTMDGRCVPLRGGCGPERSVLIALGSIIAVCGVVLLWVNHTIAAPMDFIERHLRFSPDDGDGSMEAMFLTVLVMIITVVAFRLASKTAP
jgi:hypothetical protein